LDNSQQLDLTGHNYGIIGLGDDKYDQEYNVESAPILEEFVIQHGGEISVPSLQINNSPIGQLDHLVLPRANALAAKIRTDHA
jgi:glutaredoxin